MTNMMPVGDDSNLLDRVAYPAFYESANAAAVSAQRQFKRATGGRLCLLLVAAAAGVFPWKPMSDETNVTALIAVGAFSAAILVELYLLTIQPERAWYAGRAAAETAKSLVWRYSVAGHPFPRDVPHQTADSILLDRFCAIAGDLAAAALAAPSRRGGQVTSWMNGLRASPLSERREVYITGRLEDQLSWYGQKASWNERRSRGWMLGLIAAELVGILGGTVRAAGLVDVNLLGLAASLVAVASAWRQVGQYASLSAAYALASHELSALVIRAHWPQPETEWASFVDEAERSISREHTGWQASRGTGLPRRDPP